MKLLDKECVLCNELIKPDDEIETHGSFYHKSCFLCGVCSKSLVYDVIIMGVDKIPNCVNCYESLHAKFCSKCDKKIGLEEAKLCFKEEYWHHDCFNCYNCDVTLVNKTMVPHLPLVFCNINCKNIYLLSQANAKEDEEDDYVNIFNDVIQTKTSDNAKYNPEATKNKLLAVPEINSTYSSGYNTLDTLIKCSEVLRKEQQKKPIPAPRKRSQNDVKKQILIPKKLQEIYKEAQINPSSLNADINSSLSDHFQKALDQLEEQCYANNSIRQIKLRGILKKKEPYTLEITQQDNNLNYIDQSREEYKDAALESKENEKRMLNDNQIIFRQENIKSNFITNNKRSISERNQILINRNESNKQESGFDTDTDSDDDVTTRHRSSSLTSRNRITSSSERKVTFHYSTKESESSDSESDGEYDKWDIDTIREHLRKKSLQASQRNNKDKNCVVM